MKILAAIICFLILFAGIAAADNAPQLAVPYLSQFWKSHPGLPDSQVNDNCCPASAEMCAAYVQGRQAKIENVIELNKVMGRKDPIHGAGTTGRQIEAAVRTLYKIPVVYKHIPLDEAIKEVAAGGPVLIMILYGDIPNRRDQHFKGGHSVVLIGADDKNVFVNDPDDKTPNQKPCNAIYSRADFAKSMDDFGHICVVGFRRQASPVQVPSDFNF